MKSEYPLLVSFAAIALLAAILLSGCASAKHLRVLLDGGDGPRPLALQRCEAKLCCNGGGCVSKGGLIQAVP